MRLMPQKTMPSKKLVEYAHFLLGKRDYSVVEFRRKLAEKAKKLSMADKQDVSFDQELPNHQIAVDLAESIEPLIGLFIDKRYLSDERYMDQWLRSYRKRYGTARIHFELCQKGIDRHLLDRRRLWLQETELTACLSVWRSKFGQLPDGPKGMQKQKQFLAQRGFGFDVISSALKQITRDGIPEDILLFGDPADDLL